MRKILTLGLALSLLSACGNLYEPVELPMTDPNVLSGQWQGQLTQPHSLNLIHSTANRLYARDQHRLELFDVQTGKLLAKQFLPSEFGEMTWRADGVLVALMNNPARQREVTQYDATTLAPLPAWTLPLNNPNAWSLSRDGEIALYDDAQGPQQAYSTRTRQKLPRVALPTGLRVLTLSADAQWAVVGVGEQYKPNMPIQVQNRADGRRFDVAARPLASCDLINNLGVDIETFKTGAGEERVLIALPDGRVEVRTPSGQLERDIALGSCERVGIEPVAGQPNQFVYSVGNVDRSGPYVASTLTEVGLLDVTTGKKLSLHRVGSTESVQAIQAGFLSVDRPTNAPSVDDVWQFQRWSGEKWNVPTAQSSLKLDLTTTRVSDTEASTVGTAILDGRTLTVKGKITTFDLKLKAQARRFSPSLSAVLDLSDGQTKIGQLDLTNELGVKSVEPPVHDASKPPVYRVAYKYGEANVVVGELKRP